MSMFLDLEYKIVLFQIHGYRHVKSLRILWYGGIVDILHIASGPGAVEIHIHPVGYKLRVKIFYAVKTSFHVNHRTYVPVAVGKV